MDWQCDSSCMTDSDEGLENWQNRLYELHGHRCARITKSIRWVGSQTKIFPIFDGLTDTEDFIAQFSKQIPDSQKMETLDSAFRATASRWWNGHKSTFIVGMLVKSPFAWDSWINLRRCEAGLMVRLALRNIWTSATKHGSMYLIKNGYIGFCTP